MDPEKSKVYFVGNWKMNPLTKDDAETLFSEIRSDVDKLKSDDAEIVVCPPDLFLSEFTSMGNIKLGAQDVFWERQGAFTGEVSCDMLRRMGVRYVIVGHSERRKYLLETDEMINFKTRAALAGGLLPILCVGETLEEKQRGETGEVIIKEMESALEGTTENDVAGKLLIAYEPVWAIGAGVTPTTDEIMSTGLLIRKVLAKIYSREIASRIPVLYGGSVSPQNCFELVDKTGMNGLLIGGASIKPSEFIGIIKAFGK